MQTLAAGCHKTWESVIAGPSSGRYVTLALARLGRYGAGHLAWTLGPLGDDS